MERKQKNALSSALFLIFMDMVHVNISEFHNIFTSHSFVLPDWQLRFSPTMHISGLCKVLPCPIFMSIVYSYSVKSRLEKKARCENTSSWQRAMSFWREKQRVIREDDRKNILRGTTSTRWRMIKIAQALITRNHPLWHYIVCQHTFPNATETAF